MSPTLSAIIGIGLIFVCTGIGASFVFFYKGKTISEKVNQIFLGFASGIMLSAAIFSLVLPALDASVDYMPTWLIIAISIAVGSGFIWVIDKVVPHIHNDGDNATEEGFKTNLLGKRGKMFLAVTIHNIPEGLSVGIAYFGLLAGQQGASEGTILSGALMLAVGIGIQNIPEGAVVALSIRGETNSTWKSFWFGLGSGAVEPIAAVLGLFLAMQIEIIMPWALAFAAGCMLFVIAEEMIPEMKGDSNRHHGVWSFIIGFILMMSLDIALG